MYALARSRKIEFVDAPVAGQTIGASAGTLAIFVGGTRKAFARARPLLETMGDPERISHLGPSGSGYTVKLLLNLMWFMHAVATAEALTVGVKAGVPLDKLHDALVHSQANSVFMEQDVRMILDHGDYDEGFAMKLVSQGSWRSPSTSRAKSEFRSRSPRWSSTYTPAPERNTVTPRAR